MVLEETEFFNPFLVEDSEVDIQERGLCKSLLLDLASSISVQTCSACMEAFVKTSGPDARLRVKNHVKKKSGRLENSFPWQDIFDPVHPTHRTQST